MSTYPRTPADAAAELATEQTPIYAQLRADLKRREQARQSQAHLDTDIADGLGPRPSVRTRPAVSIAAAVIVVLALVAWFASGAIAAQPTPAKSTPATVEVFWAMPDGGTPENVTYPQQYSPDGAVLPGVCYQVDTYTPRDAERFTADGVLVYGEDHGAAISWRFVCVPDEPEPTEPPTTTPPTSEPPTEEPTTAEPTEPPTTVEPTEPPTSEPPTEEPTTVEPTEPPTTVQPTEPPTTVEPTEPRTEPEPTPGVGTPTSSERPLPTGDAEPTSPVPADRPAELADTGTRDVVLWAVLVAVLAVAVGAGLLYVRRIGAQR